jgi:adenine-specific DNA-methyltransferase
MAIERLKPRLLLDDERLRALEHLVPEAFADRKINWEVLREVLGEHVEDENARAEHFGLFWPGKREARRLAAKPSKGTLVPVPREGVDEETTSNILIEGDNLEVLKLLQKSYSGRIKMIYIDPPYNTGNDFIYKDNFTEPLEDYLKRTRQMSEEGEFLTSNTKDSGRFHSNWLNMMYPRLRLAQTLLSDDGVIFVSIDDHEVHNLRQMMNEIFGEENFIAQVIWQKVYSPRMDAKGYSNDHDYILVYRISDRYEGGRLAFEQNVKQFSTIDPITGKRCRLRSLRKEGSNSRRQDRPNLFYPLSAPDGSEVLPIRSDGSEGCWRWSKDRYEEVKDTGVVEWLKAKNGWQVYVKQFYDEEATKPPTTLWLHEEVGHNHEAVEEVKSLFQESVFSNPKPTRLIKRMLELGTDPGEESIVLDFFAGSGSTAHSVIELNQGDGASRKFICIQLPESVPADSAAHKLGLKRAVDITKARIRKASERVKNEANKKLGFEKTKQDLGFKVFKLERSNFQEWQDYRDDDIHQLQTLFANHETPLVEGWKEQDVLSELLLIEGFPLHAKITLDDAFTRNRVVQVKSDFSAHRLFICLEPRIDEQSIERVASLPREDIFICIDSALTDTAKLRFTDVGNVRTI